MNRVAYTCIAGVVVVSLGVVHAAAAQSVNVTLTGDAERPTPVTTPGSGTAVVTFDVNTREVSIEGSYTDLTSDATAAHLHGLADAESATGVLFPLTIDGGTSGNFSGSSTLTESDFDGFLEDLTYINVHTGQFPGGEIRGQVIIPEPATGVVAAALGGLLLRRRRGK